MNPLTATDKHWIDNASYFELLSRWRFAPLGDNIFVGETGQYYSTIMAERGSAIGHEAHVATSKLVGWDG